MKNNNKFLDTNIDKKSFDAFNVTSMLLFFGVLATFIVSLVVNGQIVATDSGSSIRAAEEKVAETYLKSL